MEGMMAMTIALVAVVGSFVVVLGIVWIAIRARHNRNQMLHQERMLAIEKGLPVPPDYLERMPRRRPYVRGLVFSAIGLGMIVFGFINSLEYGGRHDNDLLGLGSVFLLVGIALLAADRINLKKQNGYDSGSYSARELDRPVEGSRS